MFFSRVLLTLVYVVSLTVCYEIDLYLGQECRGANYGVMKPKNTPSCKTDVNTRAQSAYIFNNNAQDDQYELIFYSSNNCAGDIVAATAGPGCITFNGRFRALGVRKLRTEKRSMGARRSTKWKNGVHTMNDLFRANNMTVHENDDDDFDDGWLDLGLGRWIGIPEGVNPLEYAETLEQDGFITKPLNEKDLLGHATSDQGEKDEAVTALDSRNVAMVRRDTFMGAYCNRYVICAFTAVDAIYSGYNRFAQIYDGLTQTRLWAILNNGYVVGIGTYWYFTKTSNKVKANACDKTDKQCILDALRDNFNEHPRTEFDTRNEAVRNYQQGVTGHTEWQARRQKPRQSRTFTC